MNKDDTICLYRAVGFVEFRSIMESRIFTLRPNGLESKYFGVDFYETLDFANRVFNIHVVAIIEAKVPHDLLLKIGDFTKVDSTVFKSGTVEVHKEQLDDFNDSILGIRHVF